MSPCYSSVRYTEAELRRMANLTETHPEITDACPYPVPGIPVGLRITCPDCNRSDVLVLPRWLASGTGLTPEPGYSVVFALRSHEAK